MCRVLGVSVGGPSRPAIAPREHKGQGTRARAQGPGPIEPCSAPSARVPRRERGHVRGAAGSCGAARPWPPRRAGLRGRPGLLRVAAAGGCCGRAPPTAGTGTRSRPTGSGAPSRRRRPTRACPGPDPGLIRGPAGRSDPGLRGGGLCVRTGEGSLHLAAILDPHTRKIAGPGDAREPARPRRPGSRSRRSTPDRGPGQAMAIGRPRPGSCAPRPAPRARSATRTGAPSTRASRALSSSGAENRHKPLTGHLVRRRAGRAAV